MNDRISQEVPGYRATTLPSGHSPFVAASFKDVDDAIAAARGLEASGYRHDQISVFLSEAAHLGYLEEPGDRRRRHYRGKRAPRS